MNLTNNINGVLGNCWELDMQFCQLISLCAIIGRSVNQYVISPTLLL